MNTSTTQPPAPQLALIALSEKATPGEWEAIGDCVRTSLHMADQTGGDLLVTASPWMEGENIQFIGALVNWFRANYSTQSRPEAELPELPEPMCLGFRNPCGITQLPDMGIYGYTADQLRAYGQQCAATQQTIGSAESVDFGTVRNVVAALTRLGYSCPESPEEQAARSVELVNALCAEVIATRPAEVGGDGVGELVSEIQFAVNDIFPPETMTEARQEYWKAGARAAIHAVNAAIEKYRTAHVNGSEVGP